MTYSFTVWQDTDFAPPDSQVVEASSRAGCMDRCLEETAFTCRSAVYEVISRSCRLTR